MVYELIYHSLQIWLAYMSSENYKGAKKISLKKQWRPFENRFVLELNQKEVIKLLEDLSNILGAFLIKQFFNSRLFERR